MSLLDLLSAFASPELTSSERTSVRGLVSAERSRAQQIQDTPWESGLVDALEAWCRRGPMLATVIGLDRIDVDDVAGETGFGIG